MFGGPEIYATTVRWLFYHFPLEGYVLFKLRLLSEIQMANLKYLFSNKIEVLLQKPTHFSIDSNIHSDFSIRALKYSHVCNVTI